MFSQNEMYINVVNTKLAFKFNVRKAKGYHRYVILRQAPARKKVLIVLFVTSSRYLSQGVSNFISVATFWQFTITASQIWAARNESSENKSTWMWWFVEIIKWTKVWGTILCLTEFWLILSNGFWIFCALGLYFVSVALSIDITLR